MPDRDRLDATFDPRIIGPHFFHPVVNCLAADELPYLQRQLTRNLFETHEITGADITGGVEGLRAALARALDVLPSQIADPVAAPIALARTLAERPARRRAVLLTNADRFAQSEFASLLQLIHLFQTTAHTLAELQPPTRLLLFTLGPAPAFPTVDPVARRRADRHPGLKLLPDEIDSLPWSQPVEFDLAPQHRLTLDDAAWYYLACGHRAEIDAHRWHAVEQDDRLTFIDAGTGRPFIEGVFARSPHGRDLIGIRTEADPTAAPTTPPGDDPFTFFRRLCEELAERQLDLPPHD